MNIRGEKALMYLEKAIEYFEQGIIYTNQYIFHDPHINAKPDPSHGTLRCDVTYILQDYVKEKVITQEQYSMMTNQLFSKDRENWLILFVVLNQMNNETTS